MASEMIAAIAALVGGSATLITTFKPKKKSKSETYYEKILLPFLKKYHENKDMNCISFFEQMIERDDDYVPPYLFYLYDQIKTENKQEINEQIKKVMLIDYKNKYKNYSNTVSLIVQKVNEVTSFLILLLISSLIAAIGYFFVYIIYLSSLLIKKSFDIGFNLAIESVGNNILQLAMYIIFLGIIIYIIYKLTDTIYQDEYSLKIADIDKAISNRIRYYDKSNDKFQF